jgi:hypothetical protein
MTPYIQYLSNVRDQIEIVFHTDAVENNYVVFRSPCGTQFLPLSDVFAYVTDVTGEWTPTPGEENTAPAELWKPQPLYPNQKTKPDRSLDDFIQWCESSAKRRDFELAQEIEELDDQISIASAHVYYPEETYDVQDAIEEHNTLAARIRTLITDRRYHSQHAYAALQNLKTAAYTYDCYDPQQTPHTEQARNEAYAACIE